MAAPTSALPAMRTTFQPKALSISDHEVRLLTVDEKPSHDGLIQCKIEHVSLPPLPSGSLDADIDDRNIPRFNALSYTWGEPEPSFEILIEGKSHRVRENLFYFLGQAQKQRRLRYTPLWIDAVCIDQGNVQERNHQVSRMCDVYRSAQKVLVWLGWWPESLPLVTEGASEFVDYGDMSRSMRRLSKLGLSLQNISSPLKRLGCWPTSPSGYIRCSAKVAQWLPRTLLIYLSQLALYTGPGLGERPLAVRMINHCSYWGRAWIVQELILARRKELLWGTEHVDWNILVELAEKTPPIHQFYLFGPMRQFFSADSEGENWDTFDFLWHFSGKDCSDLRDTIYAFSGLSKHSQRYPVDYNCSPFTCFLNLASLFCQQLITENRPVFLRVMKNENFIEDCLQRMDRNNSLNFDRDFTAPLSDGYPWPVQGLLPLERAIHYEIASPEKEDQTNMARVDTGEATDVYCPVSLYSPKPATIWLSFLGFDHGEVLLPCSLLSTSNFTYAEIALILQPSGSRYRVVGRLYGYY